jgi:hypothetical protein
MLELKIVSRGYSVKLSPHQYAFHLKHADLGCPSFILVQYHPKGATKTTEVELLLYEGRVARVLLEKGVRSPPVASYKLSDVDWDDLTEKLSQ